MMARNVIAPMPTIDLFGTTSCATRKRGVIWRDAQTTRTFGQVWETPRYRPGSRPPAEPGTRIRTFSQIVEATLLTVKAQLRGTVMRHASAALIARHVRAQLRRDDPMLTETTAALVNPVVEAVRERLCSDSWSHS
jgi:hypothetical protein